MITLIAANTYVVIKLQETQLGRKATREELEPVTWEFYQRGQALTSYEYLIAKTVYTNLLNHYIICSIKMM